MRSPAITSTASPTLPRLGSVIGEAPSTRVPEAYGSDVVAALARRPLPREAWRGREDTGMVAPLPRRCRCCRRSQTGRRSGPTRRPPCRGWPDGLAPVGPRRAATVLCSLIHKTRVGVCVGRRPNHPAQFFCYSLKDLRGVIGTVQVRIGDGLPGGRRVLAGPSGPSRREAMHARRGEVKWPAAGLSAGPEGVIDDESAGRGRGAGPRSGRLRWSRRGRGSWSGGGGSRSRRCA